MTPLQEMIVNHPFFEGFNPHFWHLLFEAASLERHGSGEIVFKEGAAAEHLYLVHSGQIALETFAPGIGNLTVQTIGAGQALGWSWLFPPYTWHFSARATEPSELIAIGARHLREMIEENPAFGRDLVVRVSKIVLQRLQATRLQLLDFYGPCT